MSLAAGVSSIRAARAQIAPIAAIAIFGMSMSMSYPLFALILANAGASGAMIGANTAAAAVAIILTAPLLPLVLRRVGLGPLMVAAGCLLTVAFALVPAFDSVIAWTVLRFLYGIAGTALFFGSEYWIVARAPAGKRGQVVAIYAIALSASFMAGPLVVQVTGAVPSAFLVGAAIVVAGLAPLLWGLADAPARAEADEAPPRPAGSFRFFLTDPALLWAIVLFGTIEYGVLSIISVWGVESGLTERAAVGLIAIFSAGALVMQWPIGRAADRMPVRPLLTAAAIAAVLCPLALAMLPADIAALALPMLIWGGLGGGLYTLALTGLGSRYTGQTLSEANSAVVFAYGLGSLLSPPAFGLAMDAAPPNGLLHAAAAVALGYLLLITWRQIRHGTR